MRGGRGTGANRTSFDAGVHLSGGDGEVGASVGSAIVRIPVCLDGGAAFEAPMARMVTVRGEAGEEWDLIGRERER